MIQTSSCNVNNLGQYSKCHSNLSLTLSHATISPGLVTVIGVSEFVQSTWGRNTARLPGALSIIREIWEDGGIVSGKE